MTPSSSAFTSCALTSKCPILRSLAFACLSQQINFVKASPSLFHCRRYSSLYLTWSSTRFNGQKVAILLTRALVQPYFNSLLTAQPS
ncbi:hypothetical protein IAQ61_007630 [Plenodomus lingam]|uniref:uncharacterized protein n=1 Tax=Leptosphaeria maculans TaxID=5022 RepID=UPI0033195796|nr:hypothetical protein IAQ61_007630 [Plenodomus lingam]